MSHVEPQPEPEPAAGDVPTATGPREEGEEETPIGQILADDEAYRNLHSKDFDTQLEATTLRGMVMPDGELYALCQRKLPERWRGCSAALAAWQGETAGALGDACRQVVEGLDALHLKPTSIHAQVQAGNDAACFGLMTLLSNLGAPPTSAAAAGTIASSTDEQRGGVTAAAPMTAAAPAPMVAGSAAHEEEAAKASAYNTASGVSREVAEADDPALAAAMEYAGYLDQQRDFGWKD
jgi:hypothetical protein|eukprot:COSAG01_NODE_2030_length_8590_cov_20.238017_3_plen_237_part_00